MKFDVIENIEEYLFVIGTQCVAVNSLYELQKYAIKNDMLDNDEKEMALTIMYEARRLFIVVDNLLKVMGEKGEIDVEAVGKRLREKIKNLPKHTLGADTFVFL